MRSTEIQNLLQPPHAPPQHQVSDLPILAPVQENDTIILFSIVRLASPENFAAICRCTHPHAPGHLSGTHDPDLRSIPVLTRAALKNDVSPRSLLLTADVNRPKKKKGHFYFPLYAFLFYLQYSKIKKKNWENWHWPVRKKEKKNSNFEFQNSNFKKKKKRENHLWDIYFHELRSSQAIELLNWDPELRPFQDPSLWAIELRPEPLSHDPTKSSWDQNPQAKIQATEPRFEPSSQDTSQAELSQDIWAFFCYQIQRFH